MWFGLRESFKPLVCVSISDRWHQQPHTPLTPWTHRRNILTDRCQLISSSSQTVRCYGSIYLWLEKDMNKQFRSSLTLGHYIVHGNLTFLKFLTPRRIPRRVATNAPLCNFLLSNNVQKVQKQWKSRYLKG